MPFARPQLQDLIDRAVQDEESRLPSVDAHLRRSAVRTLVVVHAGGMHGAYGYLDWQARQIIPDAADSDELRRWAKVFGLTPKDAAPAAGNVTFTGGNGSAIPAETVLTRSDGVRYSTDSLATIAGGTATVAVTAVEGGADGDLEVGSPLTALSSIAGVNSDASVAAGGLTGGADAESDDDLRIRLLLRLQLGPPNGKDGDYIQWALELAGTSRAWEWPLYTGLGTVGVAFVQDNGAMDATIIPNAGAVTAMQAYIDARRPAPAAVTVFAPVADALNFTIAVSPNTAEVKAAVTEELRDLIRRDTAPGGTLLLSHIDEAISRADGEDDHIRTVPAANVVSAAGHIPVMGVITWL
jgi:uncharacterized phage protein gp47/JayE